MSNRGITLVLGGIGIKGVAHFGTLRALCERGIPIRKIVCTGLSSIAAAQHSLNMDPIPIMKHVARFFLEHKGKLWALERFGGINENNEGVLLPGLSYYLRARTFCRSNMRKISILSWNMIDELLKSDFFRWKDKEPRAPIAVSAIDLEEGREVLLNKGSIIDKLRVSLSFPGILPPVKFDGRLLVNSSLYCELPLGLLSDEDRPIVAIDIPNGSNQLRLKSIIDILAYIDELRGHEIKQFMLNKPDHIFTLYNLQDFHWGNYILMPKLASIAYRQMSSQLKQSKGFLALNI